MFAANSRAWFPHRGEGKSLFCFCLPSQNLDGAELTRSLPPLLNFAEPVRLRQGASPDTLRPFWSGVAAPREARKGEAWCPWPESNQHSLRNSILSRARLPVPPQGPSVGPEAGVAKPADYSHGRGGVNPRQSDPGRSRQPQGPGLEPCRRDRSKRLPRSSMCCTSAGRSSPSGVAQRWPYCGTRSRRRR